MKYEGCERRGVGERKVETGDDHQLIRVAFDYGEISTKLGLSLSGRYCHFLNCVQISNHDYQLAEVDFTGMCNEDGHAQDGVLTNLAHDKHFVHFT